MQSALTAAQMRQAEQAGDDQLGMSSALLMENAGRALAEAARSVVGPQGRFLVVCGPGNNGGDGFVAARFLLEGGARVSVALVGDKSRMSAEAQRAMKGLVSFGIAPQPLEALSRPRAGDVVVDAIFGTGLNRAPAGPFAEAIFRIYRWRRIGVKVVAADVPSGLQSDTGEAFLPYLEADVTVSFGFLKRGQVVEPGASLCGELRRVDIGLSPVALQVVTGPVLRVVEEGDAREALPARRSDSHKGTYGHVLVVAGSRGKSGAAALVSRAVLRSGAGLVSVATRGDVLDAVLAHSPEVMGIPMERAGALGSADLNTLLEAAEQKDALVIGPGIPRGPETGKLIGELLERVDAPAVLDADALNAVASDLAVLRRAKKPVILTPHPGEMARLTGRSTKEVQANRLEVARGFATQHGVTLVLKGSRTIIASPDGEIFVNTTGNAGMATAGAGDVLSGICGAFLAQGIRAPDAAWAAVYAHGLAGDLAAARSGKVGLMASDIAAGLCDVWTRWGR